jgi:protein arginine kinase activator
MTCESCNERKATVHLTEIINDTKKEIHLCEECAKEKGVTIKGQLANLSIPEFVVESASSEPDEGQDLVCEACGMTFAKFRSQGKFGCPEDYVAFRDPLTGLLERIHGNTQHRGKVPSRATTEIARQKELMQLRLDLKQAVEAENYERAAGLRDRIRQIEGISGEPGSPKGEP